MVLSESERRAFSEFEKSGWDKTSDSYHHHFGVLTQQSSDALLDAACVQAESKVLDVATGPGYVAASAQRRGAHAIGIDVSAAQVDLARKNYPGIEFRQGDAEHLAFEAGLFDAVVMGLCLLHLPNAERGIAEAFRVLRPGGRFAATVWAKPEHNPAFRIILGAIERHATKVDLPSGPSFFRFADAEEAERVLLAAGFVEPQMQIVPQYWRLASPDDLFAAFEQGSVRIAAMLRAQPEQAYQMIKVAVLYLCHSGAGCPLIGREACIGARRPRGVMRRQERQLSPVCGQAHRTCPRRLAPEADILTTRAFEKRYLAVFDVAQGD